MPVITFICHKCGYRWAGREGNPGLLRQRERTCERCGAPGLFELMDDYYPAPHAAMFLCDGAGRLTSCGRGSYELTGLREREVFGLDATSALGLQASDGGDIVETVTEWRVRQQKRAAHINTGPRGPVPVSVDAFPAHDIYGGVLLVLTPSE